MCGDGERLDVIERPVVEGYRQQIQGEVGDAFRSEKELRQVLGRQGCPLASAREGNAVGLLGYADIANSDPIENSGCVGDRKHPEVAGLARRAEPVEESGDVVLNRRGPNTHASLE